MKQCSAVVFDMDGVIFDSESLVLACWEKVAAKYRIDGITDVMIACIGTTKVKTQEIVLNHYGEDFPFDEFNREASLLFHEIADGGGLPIKCGVREILEYLKEEKVPIAVASSTRLETVSLELRQAGLYEYFQVVMGGDQLKRSKPEPDIYLMACSKLEAQPELAYAIEDSYNGIRSAHSAGMKPIMVPDLLLPTEEMKEKSVIVLDNLLQVRDWFAE